MTEPKKEMMKFILKVTLHLFGIMLFIIAIVSQNAFLPPLPMARFFSLIGLYYPVFLIIEIKRIRGEK